MANEFTQSWVSAKATEQWKNSNTWYPQRFNRCARRLARIQTCIETTTNWKWNSSLPRYPFLIQNDHLNIQNLEILNGRLNLKQLARRLQSNYEGPGFSREQIRVDLQAMKYKSYRDGSSQPGFEIRFFQDSRIGVKQSIIITVLKIDCMNLDRKSGTTWIAQFIIPFEFHFIILNHG